MKVKFKEKVIDVDRRRTIKDVLLGSVTAVLTGAFIIGAVITPSPNRIITPELIVHAPENEENSSSENEILNLSDQDFALPNIPVETELRTSTIREGIHGTSLDELVKTAHIPVSMTKNDKPTLVRTMNFIQENTPVLEKMSNVIEIPTVGVVETEVQEVVEETDAETSPVIEVPKEETEASTEIETVPETEETSKVIEAGRSTISESELDSTIEESLLESVEETTEEIEVVHAQLLNLTADEKEKFCRMVEAEVTGSGGEGMLYSKFRVARVIIYRVLSSEFPNSMEKVLFQKRQFSPIGDGRYWKVKITDQSRQAVEMALDSSVPDDLEGALFFSRGKAAARNIVEVYVNDAAKHRFFRKSK